MRFPTIFLLYSCLQGIFITCLDQLGPISLTTIPGVTVNSPSQVQFESGDFYLDGPKVHPINRTVFEWWYFDVVSYDLRSSVVVTFFTGNPLSNTTGPPLAPNYIQITVSFPNGTDIQIELPAEQVTIVSVSNGSSGQYEGAGDWIGSPDLSQYALRLYAPSRGVFGQIFFTSVTPPHFPCSADIGRQQTLEISPSIGWVNAMPDANASVSLSINGSLLEFSGSGYHDKNWGSRPLNTSFRSWYWGHGRFGPYSIVWFDLIGLDGAEHVSSYVSKNGKVISASCSDVIVRPFGGNSTFPPTPQSGVPEGFDITFTIETEGLMRLSVTATHELLNLPNTLQRWTGKIQGPIYSGIALFEQFTFAH